MFIYYPSHIRLVSGELANFLTQGGFAERVWQRLGYELHYRLVDWEDETDTEYSRHFPVKALFAWLSGGKGIALDPDWLASDDGAYVDDDGNPISPSIVVAYSPSEQMAAYGLWLIHDCIYEWGPILDIDEAEEKRLFEEQGVRAAEVIEHRSACLLLAYQALLYANRLARGEAPTEEETTRFKHVDWAKMGAKGAKVRHANTRKLKSWAIEKFKSGNWRSANEAAHDLVDEIMDHGRTIGAHLSPSNAQRTIADWFRSYNKSMSA